MLASVCFHSFFLIWIRVAINLDALKLEASNIIFYSFKIVHKEWDEAKRTNKLIEFGAALFVFVWTLWSESLIRWHQCGQKLRSESYGCHSFFALPLLSLSLSCCSPLSFGHCNNFNPLLNIALLSISLTCRAYQNGPPAHRFWRFWSGQILWLLVCCSTPNSYIFWLFVQHASWSY